MQAKKSTSSKRGGEQRVLIKTRVEGGAGHLQFNADCDAAHRARKSRYCRYLFLRTGTHGRVGASGSFSKPARPSQGICRHGLAHLFLFAIEAKHPVGRIDASPNDINLLWEVKRSFSFQDAGALSHGRETASQPRSRLDRLLLIIYELQVRKYGKHPAQPMQVDGTGCFGSPSYQNPVSA